MQPNNEALSISELSTQLKRAIENQFDHVRVRGEISGLKVATSGHAYFTLKDDNAILNAICWRNKYQQLPFAPEEGMEVIVTGAISTYSMRSNYQILVDHIEIAGEGALLKLLQMRKEKLAKEGLFDAKYKQKLPAYPQKIGIITSPTGAVIQDMLHRIEARFPTHIVLWGVAVQGEQAPAQVIKAIEGFNHPNIQQQYGKVDVIIIARGGGSLEDLFAFNDEALVRAAFESCIPIISAIGHETDHSLLDLVADMRAPTPTAAAEFALPDKQTLSQILDERFERACGAIHNHAQKRQEQHAQMARLIPPLSRLLNPKKQQSQQKFTTIQHRIQYIVQQKNTALTQKQHVAPYMHHMLQRYKQHLGQQQKNAAKNMVYVYQHQQSKWQQIQKALEYLSYKNILKRGFAIIHNEAGELVTEKAQIKTNAAYKVTLADNAQVTLHSHVRHNNAQKKQGKKDTPMQKNLFS